jgi:hypothetical protein
MVDRVTKRASAGTKKLPVTKRAASKKRLAGMELDDLTSQGITVRFAPKTLSELRTQAETKGMGPTTLIRMWVLERLQEIQNTKSEMT